MYIAGIYQNPLPMDEEILSKIIKALPTSSNLQVSRMKDYDNGKGSPLAVQSSTFAPLREILPSRLKVLQWEIENSTVRYELEPEGIVDTSKHRPWPDALLWTDASVLKHLRSWTPCHCFSGFKFYCCWQNLGQGVLFQRLLKFFCTLPPPCQAKTFDQYMYAD